VHPHPRPLRKGALQGPELRLFVVNAHGRLELEPLDARNQVRHSCPLVVVGAIEAPVPIRRALLREESPHPNAVLDLTEEILPLGKGFRAGGGDLLAGQTWCSSPIAASNAGLSPSPLTLLRTAQNTRARRSAKLAGSVRRGSPCAVGCTAITSATHWGPVSAVEGMPKRSHERSPSPGRASGMSAWWRCSRAMTLANVSTKVGGPPSARGNAGFPSEVWSAELLSAHVTKSKSNEPSGGGGSPSCRGQQGQQERYPHLQPSRPASCVYLCM
jgi:hypothetical protein